MATLLISHQLCNGFQCSAETNKNTLGNQNKLCSLKSLYGATVKQVWRHVQWRCTEQCSSARVWFLNQLAAWRLLEQEHYSSLLLANIPLSQSTLQLEKVLALHLCGKGAKSVAALDFTKLCFYLLGNTIQIGFIFVYLKLTWNKIFYRKEIFEL